MTKKDKEKILKNTQSKENEKKNIEKTSIRNESEVDDSAICVVKNTQKEISAKKNINENNGEVVYAGFWSRYAAFVIDSVVAGIILSPFLFIFFFISGLITNIFDDFAIAQILSTILLNLLVYGIIAVYFVFTTYKFQATLGKMAVGVIVKKVDGEALSLKEIVIREILKIVQGFLIYIPFVVVAFTQKKQGLHDLAVKSVVVYKDPKKGVNKWVVGLVIALQIILILLGVLSIFGLVMMLSTLGAQGR